MNENNETTTQVQQTVTSAAEFKKAQEPESRLLTLHTGRTVRVQRPQIRKLIKQKRIPQHLVPIALKQMQGGPTTASEVYNSIELVEVLMTLTVIEPKVVLKNPAEDEVEVDAFSDDEIGEIYTYIVGGVKEWETFRSKLER